MTTASELAQRYFNQRFTYGFNRAKAIRAYIEVTRIAPNCTMAYWGPAFPWAEY